MGSTTFNLIQYGKETTKGTSVACTKMFVGQMPPVVSDRKPVYPVEQFGKRAESLRGVIHNYLYQNTLSTEYGSFQNLPFLFGMGLKGGVTASEQTVSQGDYLWDFTPSFSSIDDIDAFTLRFGDNVQAWLTTYSVIERIRISGQIGQGQDPSPVKLEADFFARNITTTTFTGAINEPTLVAMNAKLARLYVDSTWAGVGTTELTDLLRTFDVEIITGQKPKFSGSANQYFNAHSGGAIGVMATFGIEGGSTANTLFGTHQSGTTQVARLDINGPQIGSGTNYRCRLDMSGSWEEAKPIDGSDRGDNLATFVLHGFYEGVTADKMLQVSTTTNSNAY